MKWKEIERSVEKKATWSRIKKKNGRIKFNMQKKKQKRLRLEEAIIKRGTFRMKHNHVW